MIDLNILPLFFVSTFILVISPGPDLVLITSYSSAHGFRAGASIAFGIFIAGLIQTFLVTFGLGQLMQTAPTLSLVVKFVGALYLSWLGLKMLKSWFSKQPEIKAHTNTKPIRATQLILQGLFNNLMNPKALLFFSMYLPQFTSSEIDVRSQIFILGLLLSTTALIINILFSFIFSQIYSFVGRKISLGCHIDGILGLIFLGLASRIVISK